MESMGLNVGKEKATAKKKQKKTKADAGPGTPPRVPAPRRSSRLQSEHDLDGFRGVRSTLCAAAADALAPGGAAVEVMTGFRLEETDKGALEVGACAGGFEHARYEVALVNGAFLDRYEKGTTAPVGDTAFGQCRECLDGIASRCRSRQAFIGAVDLNRAVAHPSAPPRRTRCRWGRAFQSDVRHGQRAQTAGWRHSGPRLS